MTTPTDLQLRFVGWPIWVVLPMAVLAAWAIVRLQRPELSAQPTIVRRGLLWLRGMAAILLFVFLLEPTFTRQGLESELPVVAVLVDQSGSMEVKGSSGTAKERLDEAVALNLIPSELRPDGPNRAVRGVESFLGDVPTITNSLVAQQEAWTRGTEMPRERRRETVRLLEQYSDRIKESAPLVEGIEDLSRQLIELSNGLERVATAAQRDRPTSSPGANEVSALNELKTQVQSARGFIARDRSAQNASDSSLVSGADAGSPIADGLRKLADLSRYERATRIVQETLIPILKRKASVETFVFDEGLSPAGDGKQTQLPGRATDLESPVSYIAREWARKNLGAVLVVSDGRQTAGGDPVPSVRALRARGAFLTAVMVGESGAPRDAVVAEILGNSEVFLGETTRLDVKFRVRGYGTGDQAPVWSLVLLEDGVEKMRRLVHPSGDWQRERFEFPAKVPGVHTYQARIEPPKEGLSEPEASTANNQAEFLVSVSEDPLRVLIVDATPRWECRYLVTLFERDRRVEIVRRYRIVRLQQSERELLPQSADELESYDVIFLGDLSPGELTGEDQQRLEDFVSKRGGFLVCIAGPRGMPGGYSLGGLANVLPVRVASQPTNESGTLTLALTHNGSEHPIMMVLKDPALNQRLWPTLPPVEWLANGVAAKPGATVLLEANNKAKTPVVAVQRYGAGRVMWMGTPESWRWRDRLGETVHRRFWLQSVRWGLGARLRGKDPRLQAALEQNLVLLGEPAELRARARYLDPKTNKPGAPVTVPLLVRLEKVDASGAVVEGTARDLEMSPVADGNGIQHRTLTDLSEGTWKATVTAPVPELAGLSEERRLTVRRRAEQEGIELEGDFPALAKLAEAGGHQAGGLDRASAMVEDLLPRLTSRSRQRMQTVSLWDNYGILFVLMGILSAEWAWRKRIGLP